MCVKARLVGSSLLFSSALLPCGMAHASGFWEDSTATLNLRSFYIDRDIKGNTSSNWSGKGGEQSTLRGWSQSAILDIKSGYTPGPIGVGFDMLNMGSFKLGGNDRYYNGAQVMPMQGNGRPVSSYGKTAVAGKLRLSKTELKVGEWEAKLPILQRDDRSLPQTFQGIQLQSKELDDLTLTAGQFWRNRTRDSSGRDAMSLGSTRLDKSSTSTKFNYAGAEYHFNQQRTTLGAWYAQLEGIYHQQYFQLLHLEPVGDWVIASNLGFFNGELEGKEKAAERHYAQKRLDGKNRLLQGLFSAKHGAQTFYVGLQSVSGDADRMKVNGTSGGQVTNDNTLISFDRAKEQSVQLRYDLDFAGLGVPGLVLSTRYIRGWNAHAYASPNEYVTNGKSNESEFQISYTVQQGWAKQMTIMYRLSELRQNFGPRNTLVENRIVLNYPIKLL